MPRRTFLAWAGALTVAGALGGGGWRGDERTGAGRHRDRIELEAADPGMCRRTDSCRCGALDLALPRSSPPTRVSIGVHTSFVVPKLDPADWRLRIHGLVEEEIELNWDDLMALEFEELT